MIRPGFDARVAELLAQSSSTYTIPGDQPGHPVSWPNARVRLLFPLSWTEQQVRRVSAEITAAGEAHVARMGARRAYRRACASAVAAAEYAMLATKMPSGDA